MYSANRLLEHFTSHAISEQKNLAFPNWTSPEKNDLYSLNHIRPRKIKLVPLRLTRLLILLLLRTIV